MKKTVLFLVENQISFELEFSDFNQKGIITIGDSTLQIMFLDDGNIIISDDAQDLYHRDISEDELTLILTQCLS